jgi:lipopolysaccharide assembly outer membrane protein LptD (OstA)
VDPNATLGKDFPVPITNARVTQPYEATGILINPRYEKEAYAHMSANLKRKDYILSLNYIHILTPVTRSNDDFSSDAVKWKRSIGGSATYFITDNFSLYGDLKYDLARFDNIVKAEIKYNYNHKINVAVGLEMLKAPDAASYWSYYRADDTIYSSFGFYF